MCVFAICHTGVKIVQEYEGRDSGKWENLTHALALAHGGAFSLLHIRTSVKGPPKFAPRNVLSGWGLGASGISRISPTAGSGLAAGLSL